MTGLLRAGEHAASRRGGRTALLGATVLLLFPVTALAQDLTIVPADDEVAAMRLVAVRDGGTIEADLDAVRAAESAMESEVEELRLALAEAEAQVDVKKSEIDVIKTKKDLADKQDKEAEKKSFEAQEKDEELQKKLLERHVDFLKREIDYVRARRESFQSAERVYRAELALEETSGDLSDLQGTTEGTLERAMRLRSEISKQERDVLEARRDHARKKEEEAKRERRMVEAQLDIIKARNEISSS